MTPTLALEAAIARARVGAVIDAMGRRGEALAVFRRHVEELDAMASTRPTTDGLAAARARAWVRLARALVRQDDVEGARRAAARAVEVAEATLAATPRDAEARDLALETALESAQAAAWTGDWARAAAEATAAYERAGALAAEDPSDARWPRRRAEAITRAVVPLARTGRADEARRLYEEGQRLLARATEADPADERWRERAVVLAIRMADAWAVTGRPPTAFAELSAALDAAERLAARDATNAQRIHLLVDLTDRRSGERAARGDVAGALADRQANVAHAERLAERDPANAVWRRIRTHSRQRLAEAFEAVGDAAAARDAYAQSAAWAAELATAAPTDWTLRFAAAGSALGEGRNRVRAGDRVAGLATMRAALHAFDTAAAAFPASELPYRAAQARAELAETLRREDDAERTEAIALLETAIAWARSAETARTDAGAARFRAELEARLEKLRVG
jgi:hypothetical protein